MTSFAKQHPAPRTLQLVHDVADEVATQRLPIVDDFITTNHMSRAEIHDVADQLRLVATLLEHSPAGEPSRRAHLRTLERRERPPTMGLPVDDAPQIG